MALPRGAFPRSRTCSSNFDTRSSAPNSVSAIDPIEGPSPGLWTSNSPTFGDTCYRFPMLTCRPWILSEARPPVHGLLPECPIVQALRSVHHVVMCVLIPQPRARLGWRITPSSYMEFTNYRRPTIGVRTIVDRPSIWLDLHHGLTYHGFTTHC